MSDIKVEKSNPRQHKARKPWKPASTLPMPDPRDGWEHKWIRMSILSQPDDTNMSTRRREGYEPVNLEEYPELHLGDKGHAIIGGLILARIPTEVIESRKEYYAQMNADHERAAAENLMKIENKKMPIFNESETIVTTGGRRVVG